MRLTIRTCGLAISCKPDFRPHSENLRAPSVQPEPKQLDLVPFQGVGEIVRKISTPWEDQVLLTFVRTMNHQLTDGCVDIRTLRACLDLVDLDKVVGSTLNAHVDEDVLDDALTPGQRLLFPPLVQGIDDFAVT